MHKVNRESHNGISSTASISSVATIDAVINAGARSSNGENFLDSAEEEARTLKDMLIIDIQNSIGKVVCLTVAPFKSFPQNLRVFDLL